MLKRVDLATYNSFKAAQDNTWKAGVQVLGSRKAASTGRSTRTMRS